MQGKHSRKRAGTLAAVICAVASTIAMTSVAQAASRDYSNQNDTNCPAWSFGTPYYGYGTIAESVGVFCVQGFSGQVLGGPFSFGRGALYAHLTIWRHTGSDNTRGYTRVAEKTALLNGCFDKSVNIHQRVAYVDFHIQKVTVCGGSLFTHTAVGPSPGNYHGELTVSAESPVLTSNPMIDVNSYAYCFYC